MQQLFFFTIAAIKKQNKQTNKKEEEEEEKRERKTKAKPIYSGGTLVEVITVKRPEQKIVNELQWP